MSISIRGKFELDNDSFECIKICLNPNFWPHSLNFKKVDYVKCKKIKPNPIGKKWNNSLNWIIKELNNLKWTIQEKKSIFIKWYKDNYDLWEETKRIWKIKDYYPFKSNAWKTLILFLNKYNKDKSNIINENNFFKIYKITDNKCKSNYNSDYILRIDNLYSSNSKNKNYILIFCVKTNESDSNKKLENNPTKYKDKLNYLHLTLKSVQMKSNYNFDKNKKLIFTNIFLNKRI